LQRLHLGDAAHHTEVGLAGLHFDGAAGVLQFLAGAFAVGFGFAPFGLGGATLEQRQVELDADVGAADVGGAAGEAVVAGIAVAVAGDEVDGGQVAAAVAVDFLVSQFGASLGDGELGVAALGVFDPFVDAGRLRGLELEVLAQNAQFAGIGVDDLLQAAAFDFQGALGGQFLGDDEVVAGLGFVGVGDGGGADFEVAFGLFELLGDGGLLGGGELDAVLGDEDIEVGLGDAQDEIGRASCRERVS
jgi:hypothetical protein